MRKIISDIFYLPRPRVLYSPYDEKFFLHCGTQILTPGEYPEYGEEDPHVGSIGDMYENGDYITHPIDEFGEPHEELWQCVHVGFPGDKISNYHKSIRLSLRTEFPEKNIPIIYRDDKLKLSEYGIEIIEDEEPREDMEMRVEAITIKSSDEYLFKTGESYPCGLPFMHDYRISEYSDETLCKDIITTLKALFDIYPTPRKQLIMGVDRPGSRLLNDNVVKILNDSREFAFEFVCAGRDY